MIDPLNQILRDLIRSRIPSLFGETQIGFEPPSENWRTRVRTDNETKLNFYLYELRENTKLRSNARTREPANGWYTEQMAPPRIDCHYLVTAWSPMSYAPPALEPTRDEHLLLYDVLEVLMRFRPLIPAQVYVNAPGVRLPPGRDLTTVPPALQHEELPVTVALSEGVRQPGEFWSTMKIEWKPAIELTFTIPVMLKQAPFETPMVTTALADNRFAGAAGTAESWLSIGGTVLRDAAPQAGAWVQILGQNPLDVRSVDQRFVTRADGRFLFTHLRPGQYRLEARVPGRPPAPREVELPSATGEYDLNLT